MLIHYDIDKINLVLQDFYNATGARIDLFNDAFVPISCSQQAMCNYCRDIQKDNRNHQGCIAFDRMLLQKCRTSGKTERDICPFGLFNIVSPIRHNGMVLGYLFFGQMKTQNSLIASQSYADLPLTSPKKIESVSHLASILIGHILAENMLGPDVDEPLQKAVGYIHANLRENLSIRQIADQIHVSKNLLYRRFHQRFGCTVGEYINKKRVEQSLDLLANTNMSMEEISQYVGFSSASYFTRTFKKQMETTPLKYKKQRS
ncbi:MAG: AraC family transcriptional regulator [Ruminococcaceae bacterium]|nr:AraC family transcriptional regulator [Oscillospiraceae bacterium]